ncbi:MAG: hypothetical protein JO359_04885 [Candidatus Eremiobacteraeota bacterium]|nr:hypothetical protein [Candidatus Eremiobacteraeota bacterium]
MISPFPERPKRGRILEIAVVISLAIHLLLGGFTTFHQPWLSKIMARLVPPPKEDKHKMTALSTAITIEKRTKPRYVPPVPPQPKRVPVPPQPRVVPHVAVVPRQPKPVEVPRPKPTEIARIVPHAKLVQPAQPVPKGDAVAEKAPVQVAHIRAPRANPSQKMSEQQLAEMEQHFAQTIAVARANNDPTRVPPAAQPATMKRAHLDIAGIDDLMRRGEGVLTPRDWFRANVDGDRKGTCYYVDYQIQFSDGAFDSGPVYWPICYQARTDPFLNHYRGFPLPGPPPGWEPSAAQLSVISAHPLLRLYFPGKFPDAANGN